MDFDNGENGHNKKRLSHEQVRVLERSFSSSRKLEPERKLQLANQLGIPSRQVAVWYQNKRARWRTQSLEMECGAMQMRLDHAAAEKRMLEKEVDRLRRELEKAKELLFSQRSSNNNNEVEGSSSFCDTVNYDNSITLNVVDDDDDQVLQFDHDLFSSFIHGSDNDDKSFFD